MKLRIWGVSSCHPRCSPPLHFLYSVSGGRILWQTVVAASLYANHSQFCYIVEPATSPKLNKHNIIFTLYFYHIENNMHSLAHLHPPQTICFQPCYFWIIKYWKVYYDTKFKFLVVIFFWKNCHAIGFIDNHKRARHQ